MTQRPPRLLERERVVLRPTPRVDGGMAPKVVLWYSHAGGPVCMFIVHVLPSIRQATALSFQAQQYPSTIGMICIPTVFAMRHVPRCLLH